MEAGRELDALVAEKVMGWKKEPVHPKTPYYVKFIDEKGKRRYIDHPEMPLRGLSWRPSTNIAAAWEVVEKMVELGFDSWGIGDDEVYFEDSSTRPDYQASTSNTEKPYRFGAAIPGSKTTIPHAICLAARKAVAG